MHSHDLALTDGDILFHLRHLGWDTDFFDKPSYLLDCTQSHLSPSEKVRDELARSCRDAFISVKLDTSGDYAVADFLQQCGFRYIDTELVLELAGSALTAPAGSVEIVRLHENRELPYEALGSSFSHTRFHTDPHIAQDKADGVWIEYLKNFTPDSRRRIYAAKDGDAVIGTILATVEEDIATLFYVAVTKAYRGKGIGKALILKAIDDLKDYTIRTETQVKNISALNFYLKCGFAVKKSFSVFHRWVDD